MITSHQRGHEIIFENDRWVYSDTKEDITIQQACKRCNQLPTPEGYDYCLGFIPGVKSACCGHGIEEPYVK